MGPKPPFEVRIDGATYLVVPARDVMHIHWREDARRLLERLIQDGADFSELRRLVEELEFDALTMTRGELLARDEALLASGRIVGVRVRRQPPALDRPQIRPLLDPHEPLEPLEPSRRPGDGPLAPPTRSPVTPVEPDLPAPPLDPPAPAPSPVTESTFVAVHVVDQYGEPLDGKGRLTAEGRETDLPLSGGALRLEPVLEGGSARVSLHALRRPSPAVPAAIHPERSEIPLQHFPYRSPIELSVENGRSHTIVVECPHILRIQTETLVFAEASCLPVPLEADLSPLRALATALLHLRDQPGRSLLVVGHASVEGSAASNDELASRRADAMLALARRDRAAWVQLATEHGSPADVQRLLRHLAQSRGWPTDPGRTDGTVDSAYHAAAEAFQARYNLEVGQSLLEDGIVGSETLGALFDMQLAELDHMLVTLELPREAPKSFAIGAVTAGEHLAQHPKLPDSSAAQTQRRVDLFLVPDDLHWRPEDGIVPLVDSATFEVLPVEPHVPGPRDLVFRLVDHYARPMPDEPYRLWTENEEREGRADASGMIVERSLVGRWVQLEIERARAIATDTGYLETSRRRHDLPAQVEAVAAGIPPDEPFVEDDSELDLETDWLDRLFGGDA